MGFTITGNETHLFITTDAGKFGFIGLQSLKSPTAIDAVGLLIIYKD